jgi:LmbE family N-acetylglucosaminyl deacetylase
MKILVISPHPDDAELGMGGTIATLTEKKYGVNIIDLTDGEPTPKGDPKTRLKEAKKSAKIFIF